MAINVFKKLFQGDVQLPEDSISAGAITATKIGTAAVTTAKLYASAVTVPKLAFKENTFSLAADASGTASAASRTYTIVITSGAKVIGTRITKMTSHANVPLVSMAGVNSITVSVAQALIGSDLVEGVVITLEP
jgi:hypothetical protein